MDARPPPSQSVFTHVSVRERSCGLGQRVIWRLCLVCAHAAVFVLALRLSHGGANGVVYMKSRGRTDWLTRGWSRDVDAQPSAPGGGGAEREES